MKIPGMDGIEILKRMKVLTRHSVIIMTAYGELDMIKKQGQGRLPILQTF
jgi:two-component system response regulator (stage 0 sporulation protein F)